MKKIFLALTGLVALINISNAQNDTMYVMKDGSVAGRYNVNDQVDSVIYLNISNVQNDTMYIMKDGAVVGRYNVNNQVDTVIFYQPQPPTKGTFTDIRDGNVYKWLKIGSQIWMGENLKYLPEVVGPATASQTTSYYYVYGYDGTIVADAKATSNYATYGVLYNWPAAMNGAGSSLTNPSGVQGVCPIGWHLPSDEEWSQLMIYMLGSNDAGGKLKETDTTHWISPNTGATDEIGFTALPGGYRNYNGKFSSMGYKGYWWSTTQYDTTLAWNRYMDYYFSYVGRYGINKNMGSSVRCIKD